jgi:hypothetical protein
MRRSRAAGGIAKSAGCFSMLWDIRMFPRVSNLKMVFNPTSALLRAWWLFRLVLVTINKTIPSTAEYCVMLCGNACEHTRTVRCQRLFTWWCRQYRRSCLCRFRALASSLQNGTADQPADLVQAVLSGRSDSNRRSQAHLTHNAVPASSSSGR